jgi:hypothetical protein
MSLARALIAVTLLGAASSALAQAPDAAALKRERCLRRMSNIIAGTDPGWGLDAPGADVPAYVDVLVTSTPFRRRFAGWINFKFNRTPAQRSDQNTAYFYALHVLTNGLPWKEMFVGQWDIRAMDNGSYPQVIADPNGLGYFRTTAWSRRYAGNEPEGYRLTAAYRMLQNVLGLELLASANNAVGDFTTSGRERPECRGCHFDSPFALDKVARLLTRRVTHAADNTVTFAAPTDGPQVLFDGRTIRDDGELVRAMVESDHFRFRVCRLAFEYLYGRAENACEAPVFDRCMAAFAADGKMETAIATIAKDPGFCE